MPPASNSKTSFYYYELILTTKPFHYSKPSPTGRVGRGFGLYFTSSGSTGIAPFCVQTYALTLTARS